MKDPNDPSSRNQRGSDEGEFSSAMTRLEKAVQELVSVATGELSDRATSVLNETSKHLESELRMRKMTGEGPDAERARERRRRRYRYRRRDHRDRFQDRVEKSRSGNLYIDRREEKIVGVCAAYARYFGLEPWITRLLAVTGLIFMPQIVFPGYWISYFVIEKKPVSGSRRARRHEVEDEEHESMEEPDTPTPRKRQSAGNTEQQASPGKRLRRITMDMTDAELRLRRVESYVTSDRYELQKELTKIEQEEAANRA